MSPLESRETKLCKCGKKMILISTGVVLTSYPPIYPRNWWCGGCGNREPGPAERGETTEELNMRSWQKANGV